MNLTKTKLKQIIKEEINKVIKEQNFDNKTGQPVTDKGKEICAKDPECAKEWLKGDKAEGEPKKDLEPHEMLLQKFGSREKMPDNVRAMYDKYAERQKQGGEAGPMAQLKLAMKANKFISAKTDALVKQKDYDGLIKLAKQLGME